MTKNNLEKKAKAIHQTFIINGVEEYFRERRDAEKLAETINKIYPGRYYTRIFDVTNEYKLIIMLGKKWSP